MKIPLELPTIQNWSCHSCGGCCRQHAITITEEERQRIIAQNWTAADGIPASQPLFVKMGGLLSRTWYRLAHQPDGACVFLDDKGLCRIHGKFGEPAKPLACRIYPYAMHPAGPKITVSLRFSCPSVVRNLGRKVTDQKRDLQEYAQKIVPEHFANAPAPEISSRSPVDWPTFHQFNTALLRNFEGNSRVPSFVLQLIRNLSWLRLIDEANFDKLGADRVREYLDLVRIIAAAEIPEIPAVGKMSSLGATNFRLLAGQYARKDTHGSSENTWAARFRLFQAATRLSRGKGLTPTLQPELGPVPFTELERDWEFAPGAAASVDQLFRRYLRVKVAGLHYCGAAYYQMSFIEGFRSLAMVFPCVMWIARWLAATRKSSVLAATDIETALTIADHHHGYSPLFGSWGFRNRVNYLAHRQEIELLCLKLLPHG